MTHRTAGPGPSAGVARRPQHPTRRAAALLVAGVLAGGLVLPAAAAAANAPPIANVDQVDGDEDTVLTRNVLANDSDPDGGTLAVYSFTPTTYGSLVITAAGELTFTPPPNYHGMQTTTYWLSDGQGGLSLGYVNLRVAAVNDVPVAAADAFGATEDEDLALAAADLVVNDSDVDGDALTVTDVWSASHGTVGLAGTVVTFVPTPDYCGEAGFWYGITDGKGGTGEAAVDVAVACVNDPPVAVDDVAILPQGAPPTVIDVTANDTDVEGDPLVVTAASVGAVAGTVTVASASAVRFAPAADFAGDATISYAISDGNGGSASGTLVVTVVADDVAPVASAPTVSLGSGRVDERAPLVLRWSATDAGVGVASYEAEVSVNGGAWTALYKGTATSVAKTYAFGSKVAVRVRATDRIGNVSDWATGPARTVVAYQAPGSSAIRYTSGWTTIRTMAASGNAYRSATVRGRSATLTFTGREVLYVAPRSPASGYVKVYVDGTLVGRYNLRSATPQAGRIIVRRTWSVSGAHTIRVVNDQGGRRANLDAFIVLR